MSSSSSIPSPTASAGAPTESSTHTLQAPPNLKIVGIILAIASGVLIGSSFVFKKKGLLRSQAGQVAGEGVAYLKSALWWTGMIMMILGEICNFAAYAFVEAIVVTPLGALSVVICAILSSWFLNERLSFFGWLGCGLCILGSVIIALNGPQEASVGQIREFQKLFLAPGFLAWTGALIAASLVIIFYFAPRYGKKSMLWYISVCSMIGGLSVSVTTGLGAAIVQTALGDNQFKFPFMYILMAFVAITLLTEVYYLNVALALFNTAMVTPTYYVIFTFFSMVTTIVLFKGLKASAAQIITIVMGFLVICVGITILQMSKVDPAHFSSKLDRRSTLLLEAARNKTEVLEEKGAQGIEDPGMDALRGSFGTIGSVIRARSAKRLSQSSRGTMRGGHHHPSGLPYQAHTVTSYTGYGAPQLDPLHDLPRHQLYDAPVPKSPGGLTADDRISLSGSVNSAIVNKKPTIKFGSTDMVHQYNRPGTGKGDLATHEHRLAASLATSPVLRPVSNATTDGGYPPTSMTSSQLVLPATSPQQLQSESSSSSGGDMTLPPLLSPPEIKIDWLNLDGHPGPMSAPGETTDALLPPAGRRRSKGPTPPTPSQTLPSQAPSYFFELMPHSAPPTVHHPHQWPGMPTKSTNRSSHKFDLKHLFTPSGGYGGTGGSSPGEDSASLMSFPSVADSGLSVDGKKGPRTTVWSDNDAVANANGGSGDRNSSISMRKGRGRRYPKGAGDDDRDESESLWRDSRDSRVGDIVIEEADLAALPSGGIRLIPQNSDMR